MTETRNRHPFQYNHASCGEVAFYLDKMPTHDQPLASADAIFPNGDHPVPGTPALCGHCGELLLEFHLRHVTETKND